MFLREKVPPDANTWNGRLVLAITYEGTNKEIWKAKFVVQGHSDSMKHFCSLQHFSCRTAKYGDDCTKCCNLWFQTISSVVAQAYLQSPERLMRDVYLNSSKDNNWNPNEFIELQKPLYELLESGDYWGERLEGILKKI